MKKSYNTKYRHKYCTSDYLITKIKLVFNIDPQVTTVSATSYVVRSNTEYVPLKLNGKNLELISIHINNCAWSNYEKTDDYLIISNVPQSFVLCIVSQNSPKKNTSLEGLYQSGSTICTQCESEGFRKITWYLDRPDILARFTTKIIADKTLFPNLLSNGNCIARGELKNGKHWVKWSDPFPKPCYLFALVAGKFDVLKDYFKTKSGNKVELAFYVDTGRISDAEWAMKALKKSMLWDEQRFGLEYDLNTYMVVAVDFFNMGAMENKGLNIFNSRCVLASSDTATDQDYLDIERVISHEYFHNWTGNRVTCRDWFQLTLKEGLTVFRDQEFVADMRSKTISRIEDVKTIRGIQFLEDSSSVSHPIRPDQIVETNNFYSVTVYEKGAEVVRMLRTILGKEKFLSGIKLYFKRHDGQAVTCNDFLKAMEDAANYDLSHFRLWYSQRGTPIVRVKDRYDIKNKEYTVEISQDTNLSHEKYNLYIPFKMTLYQKKRNKNTSLKYFLKINAAKKIFRFSSMFSLPFPSFLCDFSSPVKLMYDWKDEQLAFLIKHAENEFEKWNASHQIWMKYIKINVKNYQQNKSLLLPDNIILMFKAVLINKNLDPELIAEVFTLPSYEEITQINYIIDPLAIAHACRYLIQILANRLKEEFVEVYKNNFLASNKFKYKDIGKRKLNNICLFYLAFLKDIKYSEKIVVNHYHTSLNMTDTLAALRSAVVGALPCKKYMLEQYDKKWYLNNLVMEKWFAIQALSTELNIVNKMRDLTKHRSFCIDNPNCVRSLVSTFSNRNLAGFHKIDGSGYFFLVEILSHVDSRNPQLASQLIEPLLNLQHYDKLRKKEMLSSLKILKKLKNLSRNVHEKIEKATKISNI